MLTDVLLELYERDLNKLKDEVCKYEAEADLWKMSGEIPNSAGNLTLHLIGNLKHFIGTVLGGTAYVRDRDLEFSDDAVPRDLLIAGILETRSVVKETLAKLSADDLEKTYPIEVFGRPMSTEYFLVHLATHLNYHLGQINYHRRFLSK
jgi:uncharacterized damage-inducible protein DinB